MELACLQYTAQGGRRSYRANRGTLPLHARYAGSRLSSCHWIGTLFGMSTRALFIGKPKVTPLISVDNYSWNPLMLSRAAHRRQTFRSWTQLEEAHHVELLNMDRGNSFLPTMVPRRSWFFLMRSIHMMLREPTFNGR